MLTYIPTYNKVCNMYIMIQGYLNTPKLYGL